MSLRTARPLLVVLAVAGLGAVAVRSGTVLGAAGRLRRADPGWLVVAVLAQAASLVAYALVVREILHAGSLAARLSGLVRTTLAGIAMGASLPGGRVASAAYWYRQLRLQGADPGFAAFAMVGTMLVGVLSLAGLLVVGVAVAGGDGPLAGARVWIFVCGAASLILVLGCRRRLAPLLRRRTSWLRGHVVLDGRTLVRTGGFALANWLLDCACLYAALAAVHASVAPQSILLAFALAQLVASVPLLPGGGGTVEATLVVTFAAFAHGSSAVVAGVLLYRLLACWGLIPVGWLAVLLGTRTLTPLGARLRTSRPEPIAA